MEILVICFYVLFACSVIVAGSEQDSAGKEDTGNKMNTKKEREAVYDRHTKVQDVINDPAFGSYGRLIFPVDIQIDNSLELEDVEEILPWYSEVNPDKTVEIANYMKNQAARDKQIFYDIYTDEEKAADPEKDGALDSAVIESSKASILFAQSVIVLYRKLPFLVSAEIREISV